MRYYNSRPPFHHRPKRGSDRLLGYRINRSGWLIEHQYGRISQQRARQCDSLPLTRRERLASLADLSVVTFRQRSNEIVNRS